ncbi:hsp70 protein domain-containing protein [Ditylenchus destructor]|uniref:Hsp70 protein domain-containing protein n=1 Tax=Ditylenchus destructor TaxID=166010 RepID=A0AAD4N0H6_9BILA|nr:hsp70 protein domain-containing protein [Ditylenchus destructor]
MPVVGYDFGNLNGYIAVARQGGIDVLTNDYSLHATPSCVSFGRNIRTMGMGARQQVNTNFKNTVINFKHLLGRKFSDPITQLYKKFVPCEVVQLPDDGIGLKVEYLGETKIFTPEQVTAAFLVKLKQITENNLGQPDNECVVSVPYFFSDDQRRALLAAGKIAGINLLKIVNENTAIGIAYGFYKGAQLPAEKDAPKLVAFVDVGHSCVQASIMAFNDHKVEVIGAAHDLTVGGLFFDDLIREHFHKEFQTKFKIDAQKKPRAWLRLLDECEKLKKQMSANQTEIPLAIECFVDDKDVAGKMKRAFFEELAEPLFQKVRDMLQSLMDSSGVKKEDIADVELIGGSSRVPFIRQIVANFFNKEPKTTMNLDDAVARGACMQCAIISPSFQVKEFHIKDSQDPVVEQVPPINVDEFIAQEKEMQARDLDHKMTADAKNALEEYCYGMRDKLTGDLAEFVTGEEVIQFQSLLEKMEQWLYEDGEDATRQEYEDKLNDLVGTIEAPIRKRQKELEEKQRKKREAEFLKEAEAKKRQREAEEAAKAAAAKEAAVDGAAEETAEKMETGEEAVVEENKAEQK